jgi:hypothetical protein
MADCAPIDALAGIEARQDELLQKLDDQNREIERALISHGAQPVGIPPVVPASVASLMDEGVGMPQPHATV